MVDTTLHRLFSAAKLFVDCAMIVGEMIDPLAVGKYFFLILKDFFCLEATFGGRKVKHELRVQIHELRVQIHELWVQILELRARIRELRVKVYEWEDEKHELQD